MPILKKYKPLIGVLFMLFALASCSTVKPYQKMHLNDRCMELSQLKLVVFESNFESYREGSAGANGGKVGGGCGCN